MQLRWCAVQTRNIFIALNEIFEKDIYVKLIDSIKNYTKQFEKMMILFECKASTKMLLWKSIIAICFWLFK